MYVSVMTTNKQETDDLPASFNIPACSSSSSSDDGDVGLVAVGSLDDAHHACRHYHENLLGNKEERESKSIWECSNSLQYPYVPTQGQYPRDDPCWPLLHVIPGTWKCARLQTMTTTAATTTTSRQRQLCGAVLWHADLAATSTDIAKVVQQEICVKGNAGTYNINTPPPEFLARGGRIVGRLMWEGSGKYTPLDDGRPQEEDDEDNMRTLTKELWDRHMEKHCYYPGPYFLFMAVQDYFESTWPALQYKLMFDDDDDNEEENEDEDEEEFGVFSNSAFHVYLKNQEYLAGRILTKKLGGDHLAATLILVFTHACPEEIGDATIEGYPISGAHAHHFLTKESFAAFLRQCFTEQTTLLRDALSNLSKNKILQVIEDFLIRYQNHSKTDRLRMIRQMFGVLYGGEDGPASFAPSLRTLHNRILVHWAEVDELEASLESMSDATLSQLVVSKQMEEDDPTGYARKLPANTLLGLVSSVEMARRLIRAGMTVSKQVLVATMSRPNVFLNFIRHILLVLKQKMWWRKLPGVSTTIYCSTSWIRLRWMVRRELP